jgi:ferredoxin-thioredoxin reductase catalytic subunit
MQRHCIHAQNCPSVGFTHCLRLWSSRAGEQAHVHWNPSMSRNAVIIEGLAKESPKKRKLPFEWEKCPGRLIVDMQAFINYL